MKNENGCNLKKGKAKESESERSMSTDTDFHPDHACRAKHTPKNFFHTD